MNNKRKKISYAPTVKHDIEEKELGDVLDKIKTDDNLKNLINELRSIEDESTQKEFKSNRLPAFNVALFKGSKRRCDEFQESEYILFDLDHLNDVQELKSRITADSRTAFCFISPRGNGLKFAFKLDKPVNSDAEFRKVYTYYSNLIESGYGIQPDPHCANSQQPCFLSFDSNLYYNDSCEAVSIEVENTNQTAFDFKEIAQQSSSNVTTEQLEQISEFLSGRITNYKDWVDVGMALSTLGDNGRKYFAKISQSKKYNDSEQEINKKYSELLKSARGQITIATLFHVAKTYGYTPQAPKTTPVNVQLETLKELEDRFQFDLQRDPNKLIGYDLNKFPKIATNFDGIQPGFYIIAADANVGKTALLANLCLDLLETNPVVKVLYFSLDDSLIETSYRFLGIRADLPINTIKAPLRDPSNMPLVQHAHTEYLNLLKSNRFMIYDLRTLDKADKIEEIVKTENNQKLVVFLDAIFNIPTANSDNIRVANMERAQYLKSIVDKYRIPLIVTAELRKKPVEASQNKKPGMHDIMETGKYAYNANAILMLSMKSADNKLPVSELKVEFVKNKFSSFKGEITLYFTRDKGVISEVPTMFQASTSPAVPSSMIDQTEVMD